MVEQAATPVNGAVVDGRDAPTPDVDGGDDLTTIRAALAEERKHRRAYEKRAKELEAAADQAGASVRSDVERLTAELARLTGERDQLLSDKQQRVVRDVLSDAADRAQARRPATVAKLIADDVELDDDGRPTRDSVRAALETLKKTDPDLFRAIGSADGAARGNGPPDAANMNAIIRRAAGRG